MKNSYKILAITLLLSCGATMQGMDNSYRVVQAERYVQHLKNQYDQAVEKNDFEWLKSHFDVCVTHNIKTLSDLWTDMFDVACRLGDVQWLRSNQAQFCTATHMHISEFQEIINGLCAEEIECQKREALEEKKRAELRAEEELKLARIKEAREVAHRYIERCIRLSQTPQVMLKEIIELYRLIAGTERRNLDGDETFTSMTNALENPDLYSVRSIIMRLVEETECVREELVILVDYIESCIEKEETVSQPEPTAENYYGENLTEMDLETLILTRLPEAIANGDTELRSIIQAQVLSRGNQVHQELYDAITLSVV